MAKKKTHEEFVKDIYQAVGDEYTVLSTYVNSQTEVKMRHNLCGHTYFVKPNNFNSGKRCRKCSRKQAATKLAKTHEQFVEEIRALVGDDYTVLTSYINTYTHVQMRHQVCGHEYLVKPTNFISGKRCPHCQTKQGAKKITKTHEQYCQEIREKTDETFVFLTEYQGVSSKLQVLHPTCGGTFEVNARNFLRNPTCHCCQGKTRKLNQKEFGRRVYDLFGDEYAVIGNFKTTNDYIKMRHNTCGYEYEMLACGVLNGNKCPKCRYELIGQKNTKTKEVFLKEMKELVGDEYSLIGEYKEATSKVLMRHNTCGHVYSVKPFKFTAGRRCPKCFGTKNLTQEEFETNVKELGQGEYEVLGQYINTKTPILLKHLTCGYVYSVRPNNFKTGKRCPYCNKSNGERRIADWLKENNVSFEQEYRFAGCRNQKPLPFDFAILNEAGEVRCLIEFDGEQHFYPVKAFGGKKVFKKTQRRDQIKNKYCQDNNILLIRIPYWLRDHVEEVLEYWLKEYQIID